MCFARMISDSMEGTEDFFLDTIASEAEKGNPEALRAIEAGKASGDSNYEKIIGKLAAGGPASTTLAPQKSMASMEARRRRLMRGFQYGMLSTIKKGETPGNDPAQPGAAPRKRMPGDNFMPLPGPGMGTVRETPGSNLMPLPGRDTAKRFASAYGRAGLRRV